MTEAVNGRILHAMPGAHLLELSLDDSKPRECLSGNVTRLTVQSPSFFISSGVHICLA